MELELTDLEVKMVQEARAAAKRRAEREINFVQQPKANDEPVVYGDSDVYGEAPHPETGEPESLGDHIARNLQEHEGRTPKGLVYNETRDRKPKTAFTCPDCGFVAKSKRGLQLHMEACKAVKNELSGTPK